MQDDLEKMLPSGCIQLVFPSSEETYLGALYLHRLQTAEHSILLLRLPNWATLSIQPIFTVTV